MAARSAVIRSAGAQPRARRGRVLTTAPSRWPAQLILLAGIFPGVSLTIHPWRRCGLPALLTFLWVPVHDQ